MKTSVDSVISRAARAMNLADEAGYGLIVLKCDSEADTRRVVDSWQHRHDQSERYSYADNMYEATAVGTVRHLREQFSWALHGPASDSSSKYSGLEHITLAGLLETFTSTTERYDRRLLFIPDVSLLTDERSGLRYRKQFISLIRDMCRQKREGDNSSLVVIHAPDGLPGRELSDEAYIIEVEYPSVEELAEMITEACARCGSGQAPLSPALTGELAEILKGFRRDDVDDLIRMAFTKYEYPTAGNADSLFEEARNAKTQKVQGVKGLYWIDPSGDAPAGLHRLVSWLTRRAVLFRHPHAAGRMQAYPPKGIVICGLPGSGKTMLAKYTAHLLGEGNRPLPLIQLSISALLDRNFGQSEADFERALRVLGSLSPLLVFVDELEKTMGDASGERTHEVIQRIFSRLLQWMQEKENGIFLIAACNRLDRLPSELTRKGRIDEVFFTGMPSAAECREIFTLYLDKKRPVICLGEDESWPQTRDCLIREILEACAVKGRFLIAADIESMVRSTFDQLFCEQYSEMAGIPGRQGSENSGYRFEDVRNGLMRTLDETRSYFDGNLDTAAMYWLDMSGRSCLEAGGAPKGTEDGPDWVVLPCDPAAYHAVDGEFDRAYLRELGLLSDPQNADQKNCSDFLEAQLEAARKVKDYNGCFRWTLAKRIRQLTRNVTV